MAAMRCRYRVTLLDRQHAGSIRESFRFGATGRGRKRRIQYGDCALARSALGQKQTLKRLHLMSALPQKRTLIDRVEKSLRPKIRHGKALLDHLVSRLVIAKTSAHRSALNQSGRISCRLS